MCRGEWCVEGSEEWCVEGISIFRTIELVSTKLWAENRSYIFTLKAIKLYNKMANLTLIYIESSP